MERFQRGVAIGVLALCAFLGGCEGVGSPLASEDEVQIDVPDRGRPLEPGS
jgi:hypothetical protein